jgi:Uri superfamily endonuclease
VSGAYILLMRLPRSRTLEVGSLGNVLFPKGNYVYIGSGMGVLESRVARHLRSCKKVKWHIDRFLPLATIMGAVLFLSVRRNECALARRVLAFPGAAAVKGFGSSDCCCPAHLVHLGATPFGKLLNALDMRGVRGR